MGFCLLRLIAWSPSFLIICPIVMLLLGSIDETRNQERG
jgi:hypothetical protein